MGITFDEPQLPQFLRLDLKAVSNTYALRCDAKQGQNRFLEFDKYLKHHSFFELGEFFPTPMIKGVQPNYLEDVDALGVPVVNTLSIRNLRINTHDCRFISEEDFERIDEERRCKPNDILLTVDGGTSIGKVVLFDLEGNYTVDSHVTILRPSGMHPLIVVYLLASPMGQLQFQRAESGASGQTAVTEDDIRRFRFPIGDNKLLERQVRTLDQRRKEIEVQKDRLDIELSNVWLGFSNELLRSGVKKVPARGKIK